MFTLRNSNPFASSAPFQDEANPHDRAERGVGGGSRDVPSALGVGSNAWGAAGAPDSLVMGKSLPNRVFLQRTSTLLAFL
jgi:hypothetical protein